MFKAAGCFRYLQNILLEAVCLEWALLVALVLRDNVGIGRVVAMARDTPVDVAQRMQQGLQAITEWAEKEW